MNTKTNNKIIVTKTSPSGKPYYAEVEENNLFNLYKLGIISEKEYLKHKKTFKLV